MLHGVRERADRKDHRRKALDHQRWTVTDLVALTGAHTCPKRAYKYRPFLSLSGRPSLSSLLGLFLEVK